MTRELQLFRVLVRLSTLRHRVGIVLTSVLWTVCAAVAMAVVATAQETSPPAKFVYFNPPVEAILKLSDGTTVQGTLTGFDIEGAHVTTPSGKKLFYSIRSIRNIRRRVGKAIFNADTDDVIDAIQTARQSQLRSTRGVDKLESPTDETPVEAEPSTRVRSNQNIAPSLKAAPNLEASPADALRAEAMPELRHQFKCLKCAHTAFVASALEARFSFCPKCGANQSTESANEPSVAPQSDLDTQSDSNTEDVDSAGQLNVTMAYVGFLGVMLVIVLFTVATAIKLVSPEKSQGVEPE
jgi:hypothetical protein